MKVPTNKNKLFTQLVLKKPKGKIFLAIVFIFILALIVRYSPIGKTNVTALLSSNQFANDKNNFCYKLKETQVLYLTPAIYPKNHYCAKGIYCGNLNNEEFDKEVSQMKPPNLWLFNLCTKDKVQVSNNNDKEGIIDLLTWSPSGHFALIRTKSDYALLDLSTQRWSELKLGGYDLTSYQWIDDYKIKVSYISVDDKYTSNSRTKYEEIIDPKTMKRQRTSYSDIPGHNIGSGKWLGLVDKFDNWELYQKEETITENQLYRRFFSLKNIQTQQENPVIEIQLGIGECSDINYLGRDSKNNLYFLLCDKDKSQKIPELKFADSVNKPAKILYKYDLGKNQLITMQDFLKDSIIEQGVFLRTGSISNDQTIFLVGKKYNLVPDYNNSNLMIYRSSNQPIYIYKFDKESNEFSLFYKGISQEDLSYPSAISNDGLIQAKQNNNIVIRNINNNLTQTFDTKLGDYFSIDKVLFKGNNRKIPF